MTDKISPRVEMTDKISPRVEMTDKISPRVEMTDKISPRVEMTDKIFLVPTRCKGMPCWTLRVLQSRSSRQARGNQKKIFIFDLSASCQACQREKSSASGIRAFFAGDIRCMD
jgi:hypothetical protein